MLQSMMGHDNLSLRIFNGPKCQVTKTFFALISGPFQWDRNEIVTIVGTDPDGDRVMARDRQGNQQMIPKTFLNPLPPAVRPLSVCQ